MQAVGDAEIRAEHALLGSSGLELCAKNENGELPLTLTTESNYNIFHSVFEFYNYETILKEKVIRDADTHEILDLIINYCYIDPFFIYGSNLSFAADAQFAIVLRKNDTYMSTMKTQEKVVAS